MINITDGNNQVPISNIIAAMEGPIVSPYITKLSVDNKRQNNSNENKDKS